MIKFLKLKNPKWHWYDSREQVELGLKFKVYYSDDNIAIYKVSGEEKAIEEHEKKHGDNVTLIDPMNLKKELEPYISFGQSIKCDMCNGTGYMRVPDLKIEDEMYEEQKTPKASTPRVV